MYSSYPYAAANVKLTSAAAWTFTFINNSLLSRLFTSTPPERYNFPPPNSLTCISGSTVYLVVPFRAGVRGESGGRSTNMGSLIFPPVIEFAGDNDFITYGLSAVIHQLLCPRKELSLFLVLRVVGRPMLSSCTMLDCRLFMGS